MDILNILDPIYGNMTFNGACIKIIKSSIFKRLKNIKQLGTTNFVYPGANHSRYEHALGVCYLCGKYIEILNKKTSEIIISSKHINLLKIAALCQGLGYGPFSHIFDKIVLKNLQIKSNYKTRSVQVFNILNKKIKLNLSDSDIEFIKLCINPIKEIIDEYPDKYLYYIICNPINGIDLDKLDYINRDCNRIGLNHKIDIDEILNNSKIIDDKICYNYQIYPKIINLFQCRYNLYREIYTNPNVLKFNYMISDVILRSNELLSIKEKINSPDFINLTDNIIHILKFITNDNLKSAKSIIIDIENDNLYKFHGEIDPNLIIYFKNEKLLSDYKVCKNDIILKKIDIAYSNISDFPLENVYFYNNSDSFKIKKKDITMVLPNKFSENSIFLVFSRLNHNNVRQIVNSIKKDAA